MQCEVKQIQSMGVLIMKTLLNNSIVNKRFFYLLVCPILLFSVSCTTKTGQKVQKVHKSEGTLLSESDKEKINLLALMVRTEKDFRYSVATEGEHISPAIFAIIAEGLGPLGIFVLPAVAGSYLIERGIRSHIDDKHENELELVLADYSLEDDLGDGLKQQIELVNLFDVTEVGYDGVLEVTVKEWGVNPCLSIYKLYKYQKCEETPDSALSSMSDSKNKCEYSTSWNVPLTNLAPNQKLLKEHLGYVQDTKLNQVGLHIQAKMAQLDGVTLWESEIYQLDTECHSIEEFRSNGGLLKESMMQTTDALSKRIIEEIQFQKNRGN
jgi:hypothetical protein